MAAEPTGKAASSSPPVQDPDYIEPEENPAPLPEDTADDLGDTGSFASSLTSITSSVLRGVVEGGRTYAVYGQEEYGMPMDNQELDRMELAHAKYYALLDKKRYLAPIGDKVQKVMDLGCGTGLWAVDFADSHPSADVLGVDIAPVQSSWVPPNCRFEIDDIEQEWTHGEHYDYIFARDLILAIRDWPKLMRRAKEHLKPGGWLELQSVHGKLYCDDGSMPLDCPFNKLCDVVTQAAQKFGTPVDDPARWAGWMKDEGYTDVVEKSFKMPINPWPKDDRLKLIATMEMDNMLYGMHGMVSRLFGKAMGFTNEETQAMLVDCRKDVKNQNYHMYWVFKVVYGRKPE